MRQAFTLALQLLTRLPVPSVQAPIAPAVWGQSVLWFPAVGLVIGGILVGLRVVFSTLEPAMLAALLLSAWVIVTGALHIDGLADTADAWIGGQGDRDRTLALMKDPQSGPMALAAVGLLLINQWAALQTVCAHGAWLALLFAPVWGRMAMVILLLTTPYVRPGGLGAPYAENMPRWRCRMLVLGCALITLLLLGMQGALLLSVIGAGLWLWRHQLMQRLGGTTGDTLGAACALTEMATLLVLA